MNITVKSFVDENTLRATVATASRRSMYKASALAMRMARQKIRFRSYKISSRPGAPPFKHTKGSGSFSHSIRFYVDGAGTTAVIGPQKEGSRVNPSGPIPKTLEFGGRVSKRPNTMWFQKRNVPWGIKSRSELVSFIRRQGHGPLYMATRPSALRARLGNRPLSVKRAPNFKRSGDSHSYNMVYYLNARITSNKQADMAAGNIIRHFGYPSTAAATIAPRPFMGPTLRENEKKILSFWQNCI